MTQQVITAERRRRDAIIAAALADGRIVQSSASGWRRDLDRDPAGTERLLTQLAPSQASAAAAAEQGRRERVGRAFGITLSERTTNPTRRQRVAAAITGRPPEATR